MVLFYFGPTQLKLKQFNMLQRTLSKIVVGMSKGDQT